MGNKSISITVHPSTIKNEYLTVEDAMRQVLDMIETIERTENAKESDRKIVWRLTEAHTNSPPFTVTAEAFSKDPNISVVFEATRVLEHVKEDMNRLFSGESARWIDGSSAKSLAKLLARNLNGISHTEVLFDGQPAISISPSKAKPALRVLERVTEPETDYARTEMGSIECEVIGLMRHYNSPALQVKERLSGDKIICILSDDLASEIGPRHSWLEAWQGQTHRFSGVLVFDKGGSLRRVNASRHEEISWKKVDFEALRGVDIIGENSIQEHLDEFWGYKNG